MAPTNLFEVWSDQGNGLGGTIVLALFRRHHKQSWFGKQRRHPRCRSTLCHVMSKCSASIRAPWQEVSHRQIEGLSLRRFAEIFLVTVGEPPRPICAGGALRWPDKMWKRVIGWTRLPVAMVISHPKGLRGLSKNIRVKIRSCCELKQPLSPRSLM